MKAINIASLPGAMSPSQVQDEIWLRRRLRPKVPKQPQATKLPVGTKTLDEVDDLLLRMTNLMQRLYDLRQTLAVAADR